MNPPFGPGRVDVLDEPRLEFRHNQDVADPHDGLSLFGPFDADMPSHPKNISFALVGTNRGIDAFNAFVSRLDRPVFPPQDANVRLWPAFPGFGAAFDTYLPSQPTGTYRVPWHRIDVATRDRNPFRRVFGTVQAYLDGIETVLTRDEPVHVIVCVVPDVVYRNCRPLSQVSDGVGAPLNVRERKARRRGQLGLLDEDDPAIYQYSVDFRRQIKARAMKFGVPIQIIQESTLRLSDENKFGQRALTYLSDRAWNLAVAMYYKSGGKPWRLNGAREGVCYIGIAYRRASSDESDQTACCAAQMFLDSGDGIVFLGSYGPWYSPTDRSCHMTADAAQELLEGVLQTYQDLEGRPLREIFIHSRSRIGDEEIEGFERARPKDANLVCVRIRRSSRTRLFRSGQMPVLRGTWWKVTGASGYLWASGFKPSIGTYDGLEIPRPLRIDVARGDVSVDQVARDVLSLTKLNYNACRLGDADPVTIGYSDAVGEILVSNPTVSERSPKFKFYI
ncbi:MAG: hypothetical protein HY678_12620 [Chloroflexi bacterium]|nr:hypothetical protein [Chloroflexota bacterium]